VSSVVETQVARIAEDAVSSAKEGIKRTSANNAF
jgi:hypothetical protein